MLYLVLSPDAIRPGDTVLTAVLATTATPLQFSFRSAQRFTMRGEFDTARFDWRERAVPSQFTDYLPGTGNYYLPDSASAAGLGWRDVVPGRIYALDILTGGRTIVGRVVVPERPQLSLVDSGGMLTVYWQRVAGAAGYAVGSSAAITQDTSYLVTPEERAVAGYRLSVTAVDTNWASFVTDSTVVRAGITGAYGLFGATVTSTIVLQPSVAALTRSTDRAPRSVVKYPTVPTVVP